VKPLLRIIEGGKKPKMKFASFGRDRDIEILRSCIANPLLLERRVRQTTAAHDLKDGRCSVDAFIEATREAVWSATQSERDGPLALLARIAEYYPACLQVWLELSESPRWQDRFAAACRLYSAIPEDLSDRLFNLLRNDKSARVRAIARDRYANRPGEDGYVVFGRFDPDLFDERVGRGEVVI
jgi:hypothetical protein